MEVMERMLPYAKKMSSLPYMTCWIRWRQNTAMARRRT